MMGKKSILALFIGAILTISLVTSGAIPQVFADDDDEEFEFDDLHFKSAPCRVAMPPMVPVVAAQLGITVNPDRTLNGADCKIKAWFDEDAKALKYKIKVKGMEVEDTDGDTNNDIGKMHFHNANLGFINGNPDDPIGPQHILNIFKAPGQDDADLVVKAKKGILKGIWDKGDTTDRDPQPVGVGNDDTFDITDKATQEILCDGEAFLMIHGVLPDGSLPGFIKASIQPTKAGQNFCADLLNEADDDE